MNFERMSVEQIKESFLNKLRTQFACDTTDATPEQLYQALALVVRDEIMQRRTYSRDARKQQRAKKVYYLSAEFLVGRTLHNNMVALVNEKEYMKALDELGIGYEQTAVGDKYVAENMLKNGYSIGGEQSGHIIFSKYAATGDGILTSLMVMEACIEKKATLCDLANDMKEYPQLLRNVRVADKKTARENPKVIAAVEAAAEALGSDGRILVRESGTEPVIRVMVEAGTDDLCKTYVDSVVKVMEEEGLVID